MRKYPPGRDAKPCTRCGVVKPLTDYTAHARSSDGRQSQCRTCRALYQAQRRTLPGHAERHEAWREARRQERMGFVMGYLAEHPCVDCGEADPVVLEFDHVRGTKRGTIADLLASVSMANLVAEIAKCDVRCANCHRRKTAAERGWWLYLADHNLGAPTP